MKKIYFILLFIALLIGIISAIVYYKYSQEKTDVLKQYNLEPLACDLLKNPCKVNFNDNEVGFDISPRPVIVMDKSTITISNLNYDFYDPKIRIHGLNMDMGTIITALKEVESKTYQATVALSACLIEDVMRYRISIYDANTPIGLFLDFDLER